MLDNNTVTIRVRDSSDVPTLIRILTDVHNLTKYPVDGPSSFPARFQSPNALISIVALYDNELAGHVELQPATVLSPAITKALASHAPIDSFATLVSLFVDPKFQGKGIGTRLIDEAVAYGKNERKRLALIVLEKDTTAIRMYEKMGWERGVEYFYETIQGVKYRAFSYLAPA
jgi:ribosomal protein S18 acetylase RimI-like enzyme